MASPKTITTYLLEGDPLGIKIIQISSWIGKMFVVPRSKIDVVKDRLELKQPGIYFLFGKDENSNKDLVYIGEAEKIIDRLYQHHRDEKKDFWNLFVCFISKDNESLTKSEIKFLESKCIEKVSKAMRYELFNNTAPGNNRLAEHKIAEMDDFLEYIDLLISSSGMPIFTPLLGSAISNQKDMYYIKAKGREACAYYTEEGFLVLKGSTGCSTLASNGEVDKEYWGKKRNILTQEGVLKIEGEDIVFNKDYLFSSPSMASGVVLGRPSNGRTERKDKNGNKLDQLRK